MIIKYEKTRRKSCGGLGMLGGALFEKPEIIGYRILIYTFSFSVLFINEYANGSLNKLIDKYYLKREKI